MRIINIVGVVLILVLTGMAWYSDSLFIAGLAGYLAGYTVATNDRIAAMEADHD